MIDATREESETAYRIRAGASKMLIGNGAHAQKNGVSFVASSRRLAVRCSSIDVS